MGVPAGQQLDGAAGREAGTNEQVESGLTTFLTVSPLYDRAHEGLTLLGDLCRRRSDGSEARLVECWGGRTMKRCDGGMNRIEESSRFRPESVGHGGVAWRR
jgi:hypothetical protein